MPQQRAAMASPFVPGRCSRCSWPGGTGATGDVVGAPGKDAYASGRGDASTAVVPGYGWPPDASCTAGAAPGATNGEGMGAGGTWGPPGAEGGGWDDEVEVVSSPVGEGLTGREHPTPRSPWPTSGPGTGRCRDATAWGRIERCAS